MELLCCRFVSGIAVIAVLRDVRQDGQVVCVGRSNYRAAYLYVINDIAITVETCHEDFPSFVPCDVSLLACAYVVVCCATADGDAVTVAFGAFCHVGQAFQCLGHKRVNAVMIDVYLICPIAAIGEVNVGEQIVAAIQFIVDALGNVEPGQFVLIAYKLLQSIVLLLFCNVEACQLVAVAFKFHKLGELRDIQ